MARMSFCILFPLVKSLLKLADFTLKTRSYLIEVISLMLVSRRWRKQWHPTPVLLPGKSHGRRSLVGCSPWGRKESDTTERLHFHFSLSCIGEGNGNPLQCSCLENPRDGGAWWTAVYGVAQSRTQLKWLSSSSNRGGIHSSFSSVGVLQSHLSHTANQKQLKTDLGTSTQTLRSRPHP